MRTNVIHLAFLLASTAVIGCESATEDCAEVGRPAVRAHIRDSVTGRPLAYRASLIVRDGAFSDSVPYQASALDSATFDFIDAAIGREGTYTVTVRREGSRVWTRNGVRAHREDGCRLESAELTVRLQPSP